MVDIDPFDLPEDDESADTEICPSCGALIGVERTPNCHDPLGCGADELDDVDEEDEEFDEEYEDEADDELDFS